MADPKALYDALFQDKLYTKTYGEFIIQFAGDKAREELYTTLSSDKLYTKSLDEFNEQFFDVKKKEVSEVGGTPSEISGEVQQPLPSELEKPDLTLQTSQFRKEEIPNYIEKGAEIPRPVPKAKTFSDYVGAFAGTIDEGLADMVDMVDYLGTGTQDAIYQIMFGKETANAVSKLRKEGMLPTAINPPRLTEGISQVLRYAGRHKELPKDTKLQKITSGVLEGTAGIIPPILATFIAPEIKLPAIFQKLGLKQLSKFGTVIGTEAGVRAMETTEKGTILEKLTLPVLQGLEGFATGMTFDALGAMSSKIGIKIADKILPVTKTTSQIINKALLQTSATSLTNATFFGGYGNLEEYLTTGKISAETFATNFGMGLALGLREPGRLLYTKGINTLISTPIEIINKTIQNDLTSEQLAKQAQEKIDNVESGQSANKELDIISAKILANASILKSTTEEIIKNPDDVITSIKESELDPKLQETIIDKVNEVVVENEPNVEEKKPIREKLRAIEEEFENIKNNKSLTKAERDIKQEKLTAKIEQFKNELLAVKAKPKEKEEVIPEPEKKEEVPLQEEPKPIAKDFGVDVYYDDGKYKVYDQIQASGQGQPRYALSEMGYGRIFESDNLNEVLEKAKTPQKVSEPKVEEVKPVTLGEKIPVTKGEKGILDIKEENAFTVPITQAGKDIGNATIENLPEGWRIKWIDVEGARKTGTGREAMRLLNQQANKEGKVLISDIEGKNTVPMVRAWEKLIESGEAEQTPDGLWRMKPAQEMPAESQITPKETVSPAKGEIVPPTEKVTETVEKPPKVQEPSLKEREAEIKPAKGIKYKDKTYVSVEDIQEDFDKFESLQEYNKILEKVRKFEDGLKADAIKTSDETAKKLGIVDRVTEEKRLGEVNDRLNIKLLPDIPTIANDILYKQLVKVRDGLANTTANLLQKGMKSQNDILRWMSKFITNWWGGLGRTQADIHGKEGKIGKLEMKGTTQVFALYEAKQIRGKMLELVNDPESLEKVWSAYDPELATEKVKFEDLTIAEQNLYNLIKDWNTWVWSTNYALGIIPTESHLKYLDTENEGKSTYIARMYDKWEIDELPPEINEHITKGSNSVTTKMITDYLKARKEVDDWKKEHAITDPTYLTTKRIMQTIQNVAIKEYIDAVISEHPDFVLELKKGEEVPKGYKKMGSSWGWGQFRNKAVINHIVEDFTGFFYANKLTNVLYDALKLWDRNKINQFYKKFRTLYNPMVQVGNMTGNVFFASINGINPAEFLAEQITVLRDRVSKVDEDVYKSVLKSGLMGDVGITGDMTPPKESIKDLTTAKTPWGRIKEILHKGNELASDVYIGTDNVAKYAAYRVFRKRGFTHAQSIRRAYDAFQNYMTVGKTWDVASKLPVIGPTFVKFQADLQRIITNAILTTPLTAIGTVMLIKLFGILTSHLSGESDEEREEREKRKGVAKIPIVNVPLSFKIGKAELNGARYLSPLYIYKQEDSESDLAEFSKYLPLQFVKASAPQLGEKKNVIAFGDATWGWLGSVMADRDFRSISIRNPEATIFFNPNITTDQKIANVMNYVLRSQLPFYKSFEDITDGVTGKLDYYGRKRTWYQAIMNGIIKIQEFDDPELKRYVEGNIKYLTNKFAGLSEAMGDANALFLKELQKAEDLGISKEAMDKLYKVEDRRRAKNMEQSLKEQIPVLQEIERQVNVYKKWYPDDPFIKENFMNIEAGKNRIFDIKSDIDFQKKYKEEYNLLKKNGLIKKPDEIPTAYKGIKLSEEQCREYIATYWSEYVRYLDAKMGLTQENINKYKSKITKTKKVKTKLEPEITTALDEKISRAREEARDKAEKRLKQTIKNQ